MELFHEAALKLFHSNKTSVLLIAVAIITCVISMLMFLESTNGYGKAKESQLPDMEVTQIPSKISVQIAGAVVKPRVYDIPQDYRLKDLLKLAGGLNENADEEYFYRSFNLAKKLNDQDKIYIPSKSELTQGNENDGAISSVLGAATAQKAININKATEAELDALPGVGPSTVAKIIQSRPYTKIEDLLTKKVFGNAAFQKLKSQITTE